MIILKKDEIRRALSVERETLINLVSSATEEQLNAVSLCSGWSNRNVIGHILGFELSMRDALKLIFKKEGLDSINNSQAKRYENCSSEELVILLRKGHKRLLRLLWLTPKFLLNRKIISVPNGHISIAQIYGDLVLDRAIHYLDVADPLGIVSTVIAPEAMIVSLKFLLKSIDLLNPSIPKNYYGNVVELKLSGLCGSTYYWNVGTDYVREIGPRGKPVLVVSGDTNDFLFTVVVRESLLLRPLAIEGANELKELFKTSMNANKLWEH